jgi:hypothetical protein
VPAIFVDAGPLAPEQNRPGARSAELRGRTPHVRAASTRLVCAAALAAVALVACKGKPSGPAQAPLQPLPPPPALTIAPEALPTTGLTVVASRPHEVVGADARPTITFSRPVVALMSVEEQKGLAPPA